MDKTSYALAWGEAESDHCRATQYKNKKGGTGIRTQGTLACSRLSTYFYIKI